MIRKTKVIPIQCKLQKILIHNNKNNNHLSLQNPNQKRHSPRFHKLLIYH